jgi:type IV pilus biogenesis protein CpaD/CtpE
MSRYTTVRAALISWRMLMLVLGLTVGCATTPSSTTPSATTDLLTARNKVAGTVRMAEMLDLMAQQAWEHERLSAARYQHLHEQFGIIQHYWKLYAELAAIDLTSRGGQSNRQTTQTAGQGVMDTFQGMLEQAQAWGLVQDINELQP